MLADFFANALRLTVLLLFPYAAVGLRPSSGERAWPKSLPAHVARGTSRTIREAAARGGLVEGGRVAATISALMVQELLVFPAKMVPFAARTLNYRRSRVIELPATDSTPPLEVFSEGGAEDGPLVLYVHGGSWGQGAPWQYALLGKRLLEEARASRVAIVKYPLFPESDVDGMAEAASGAMRWGRAQQAAAKRAGRELPVVLAAQSAGAHLCALALARRSCAALAASGEAGEDASWVPDRFVALSGVFSIAPHFAHESTRLVHWLSPMWQAMACRKPQAGREAPPDASEGSQSAGRLFDTVASRLGLGELAAAVRAADTEADADRRLARAGLDATTMAAAALTPAGGGKSTTAVSADWTEADLVNWALSSPTLLLRLQALLAPSAAKGAAAAASSRWPPTTLVHAADDSTVPISSCRDFAAALSEAVDTPVSALEFERGGHGELMVALMAQTPLEALPESTRLPTMRFVQEVAGLAPGGGERPASAAAGRGLRPRPARSNPASPARGRER